MEYRSYETCRGGRRSGAGIRGTCRAGGVAGARGGGGPCRHRQVPVGLRRRTGGAVGSVLPASRHISSAFGWRRDPFTQEARFHHGTDLRAAYGQDVRAAGDGVVTFAGDRGGYGLTVVVDHGGGVETRYAHLSAADVKPGTRVRAGEVLARSGNSGRSTGAHLHFEVRRDGQAVDPREFEGRFVQVVDLE